jgi:hypothetical protein
VRIGLQVAAGTGNLGLGGLVDNNLFNRQRLVLIVLVALFVATIQWVGTTLDLFLVLIGCMWTLGVRGVRTLVGVAFVTAAVVHLLLITLLGSKLPQGVLVNLIWPVAGGS